MWTTKKGLLIIGGGILQEQTLAECEKLGLDKVLVDGNINCYCNSSPYLKPDNFILADIKNPKLVLSQFKEWKKKHKIKIVGVYTQGCDCTPTVAYVAEKLRLPSIGYKLALYATNKKLMRHILEDFVRQPAAYSFENYEFPLVVKPTDNCASRGITIVRNREELEKAIITAKKFSSDHNFIMEEFLDGKEYSVDTIVYKSKVYPAGISDRIFLEKENYCIQDGSLTPSSLSEEKQEEIYKIMQTCAYALGLNNGALKGDIIIQNGLVYVLEITARLSGGFDSQFRKPFSFGINLIKATIDLACGKELDFADLIPRWNKFSQTFSIFPKEGKIKKIIGIENLKNIYGVREFFVTKKVGEEISYKNCSDRVIHIVACRDTYEGLQGTIRTVRDTVKFITE